jgi:hypothetical protein
MPLELHWNTAVLEIKMAVKLAWKKGVLTAISTSPGYVARKVLIGDAYRFVEVPETPSELAPAPSPAAAPATTAATAAAPPATPRKGVGRLLIH